VIWRERERKKKEQTNFAKAALANDLENLKVIDGHARATAR
jgi:hypothetical protein